MKKSLLIAALALVAGFASAQTTDTIVSLSPSNKNVVLEEFTGVNCSYCPDGHRIVNEIAAANPGRVFPINIHTGGYAAQYQTDYGAAIADQTGLTGYPSGTVNRHVFSGTTTALGRGSFSSASSQIMAETSPVNIAAQGTLDYTTRELNITVQLYYTSSSAVSTNMLNIAILQNNVLGSQLGSSYNPDQVVGNQYNHMHMLRHLITGQWGDTIYTTTAGTFVEKQYTYVIPEQLGKTGYKIDAVLEDLTFVAFVAEGRQEILTGTEATITGINLPAISSRLSGISALDTYTCDGQQGVYATVVNNGTDTITEIQFQYSVASGSAQTFTWYGSIAYGESDTVHFPMLTVNPNVSQVVTASIISVNGESFTTDERTLTVKKLSYTGGGWMRLEIKTDSYGSETTYEIFDPDGNVFQSGGPFSNTSEVHSFTFEPDVIGCYRISVYDSYGDGINNGYGTGYIRLYDASDTQIFGHNGKFDSEVHFMIDVTTPTSIEDHVLTAGNVLIYPNPTTSTLTFNAEETISRVEIYNMQGQKVLSEAGDVHTMNVSSLSNGLYMVKVTTPTGTTTQKVVKQ